MKKPALLFLIFLLSSQNILAQKNLVGSYYIASGNPDDGGYTWFLFENNKFAMVTFGQIAAGTWTETSKNEIQFEPYSAKESFQVFGRNNPNVKGTKFIFQGLDINEDSWIGISDQEVQPLLNSDANCLDSPIVKTIEHKMTSLFLASCSLERYCERLNSYQFAIGSNNEFLVLYFDSQNTIPPFKGSVINNQLNLEFGRSSTKKRKITNDDRVEINAYLQEIKTQYTKKEILLDIENQMVKLDTPLGAHESNRGIQGLSASDYNIDLQTGIFTAKEKFSAEFLESYNTLFLYKKLDFKMEDRSFRQVKNSFLQFSCN